MSWFDREASNKTVVAPRRKPGELTNLPANGAVREQTKQPRVPRSSSLMAVVLGLTTLLLLGAAASLVTIHVLTGGRSEFSDAVLDSELVAVAEPVGSEQQIAEESDADIEKFLPPKIIELSGDPVVVKRRPGISRQLVKLADDVVEKAKPRGVGNEIYRMDDTLVAPETNFFGGLPGSQQDFAFFQSADDGPDASAQGEPEEGTMFRPLGENSSVVEVNANGEMTLDARQDFVLRLVQNQTLKQLLTTQGFGAGRGEIVESAFDQAFQVRELKKGDNVAIRGTATGEVSAQFLPVQISVYRNERLVGTLALNELDNYVPGADPWFGRNIFDEPEQAMAGAGKQRLLDAIYNTAVRNNLPTSVAGETILLLSRSNDLEQAADDSDGITILYSNAARDRKTGFGRVLYVRIQRSAGDMECYAFQAGEEKQFDCVSVDGRSSATDGSMVTPVRGVIAAKFGPIKDAATGKKRMNFGVNWSAPLGSTVVAAFAGEITFAGTTDSGGNVIKITHADKTVTSYSHLQRFARTVSIGSKLAAGQPIGYVGQTGDASEPLLHFELVRNGQPVDPFGEYRRSVEKGGVVDSFVNRIIYVESANNCNARNPLSTAVGLGQFIESTWINTVRLHRPDLMEGRSRSQILEFRVDCELAREMTTAFTRDNASVLRVQGHEVSPGNLYLSHFLGVGGALKVLSGNPGSQISEVFGSSHVEANPFEAGKTLGWLIEWAARKMNQRVTIKIADGAVQKLANKFAGNKAFAELKRAIEVMLQ